MVEDNFFQCIISFLTYFFFSKIGNIRILIASGSWVWLTRSRQITLHESRYNKNAKTWHTWWTRWWCINYNLDKNQYMPQICLKKCPRFDDISKTFIYQWVTHWLSNTDPKEGKDFNEECISCEPWWLKWTKICSFYFSS